MHRVFSAEQASLYNQFEAMIREGKDHEEVAKFFKERP